MIRTLFFLALMASISLMVLTGCGEKTPEPGPAPTPKKVATPPSEKGKPVPSPEDISELSPPPYRYDPTGRRDPFESLLDVKKPVSTEVPLTPLQKFGIGQLRLIGVIVGKGEPRAMVVAPDGKSYILKKGIKVGKNDGKVVDINQDAVVVEESYADFSGEVRTGIREITLPRKEGVE
jgi:type IV pilus assembly protein PilP